MQPPDRRRVVVSTSSPQRRGARTVYTRPKSREWVLALSVIGAAALATLLALFLTSRPYDPMNSSFNPQSTVPAGGIALQSSPTPSPSPTAAATPSAPAEAAGATPSAPPDDAAIQNQIERRLKSDAALADLDVSTIVEGGRVTVLGSVQSSELKQRIERVIRGIDGVVAVDNQLVVIESTPQ